ncbi:hypothetical protein [Streptomyces sp. NPDC006368]|uniref:hypothetical protein n=1 Tax=Streptomyces sp. NPDC006368 TaxID=3156760 RepID=UPI0033B1EB77
MRSALRTALATAVIVGVALAPAVTAGAAFAAEGAEPAPGPDMSAAERGGTGPLGALTSGVKQAAPRYLGKGATGATGPAGAAPDARPQGGTARTAAQATIVPRGGVATGAEVEEGGNLLVLAGAGAAAVTAAGLGFVALRRRTAGARA